MVGPFVDHPFSVTATFRFPTRGTRTVSFDYRISEVLFYKVKSSKQRQLIPVEELK